MKDRHEQRLFGYKFPDTRTSLGGTGREHYIAHLHEVRWMSNMSADTRERERERASASFQLVSL